MAVEDSLGIHSRRQIFSSLHNLLIDAKKEGISLFIDMCKEYALKNSNISLNDYNECLFYTDNISDFSFIKFLQIQSNNLKVYPIINNKRNITIRQKFLNNNEIKYEFIS